MRAVDNDKKITIVHKPLYARAAQGIGCVAAFGPRLGQGKGFPARIQGLLNKNNLKSWRKRRWQKK